MEIQTAEPFMPETIPVKVEIVIRKLRSYNTLHSTDTREKWEHNGTVHQLFIDIKRAVYSIKTEVF
jgi:hypothetical protein